MPKRICKKTALSSYLAAVAKFFVHAIFESSDLLCPGGGQIIPKNERERRGWDKNEDGC